MRLIIKAMTRSFSAAAYRDAQREALEALVDRKIGEGQIEATMPQAAPGVESLMELLRSNLAAVTAKPSMPPGLRTQHVG
jgi:non-homologous end joining protein Ku